MSPSNDGAIESMLALKLMRLSKKDRNWVLARLPKKCAKQFRGMLKDLSMPVLSDDIYQEIHDSLRFDSYLRKSELDEKAEALNSLPAAYVTEYIKEQPPEVLWMVLLSRSYIRWASRVISYLKIEREDISKFDEEHVNNRENLVNSTVSYLHRSLCVNRVAE